MPGEGRIKLFDQNTISKIKWPSSEESSQAQQLPLKLLKEGVHPLIPNIKTRYFFLQIDQFVLPITVNEKEYKNSYLTSNYYAIKKMREESARWLHPFIACCGFFLKCVQVNRSVIVNNWLLSNSLYPKLTEEQIELMTRFLKKRFPSHMIMLRGINEADGKQLLSNLKKQRYHTFFSREICYYDPQKMGKRSSYHRRRDEKVMLEGNYYVEESTDYEQMIALFNSIYREKHTIYCPHYTEEFLRKSVESGFLKLCCLKQEGKVVGVFGYQVRNQTMIVPFFGYRAEDANLYRILIMLVLKKAEELEVCLNDGSGGEQTKKFRGMKPFNEYAAIHTQHLPLGRRLFWKLAALFSSSS